MAITMILFDLDGTLLPMDQDVFVKTYFGKLATKLAPLGYEPEKLIHTVWAGTVAMTKNDGSQTNEAAFWKTFTAVYGEEAKKDMPHFEAFYQSEFQTVKEVCGFTPQAAELISELKEKGLRVVLATSPLFPAIATESRIRWAGMQPEDFELYTTYENCSHCKPNPAYYTDILKALDVKPEECLMVGNDVGDDMIAETLGMQVFLLTDCLINKGEIDISRYPHGDFAALRKFIDKLGHKH